MGQQVDSPNHCGETPQLGLPVCQWSVSVLPP